MNKFLSICLAGAILNAAGIALDIYILNIIGSILTTIGIFKLNLDGRTAKKAKIHSVLSIPFSIIAFFISTLDAGDSQRTLYTVTIGINIFFFIYFTFYLTEALIECAKGLNELAATRSFRSIWTLCGFIAFAYFLVYSSLIPSIVNIAKVIFLLSAFYYCSSLNSSSKTLFNNK